MYLELDRLSKQFDGKYAVHDLSLGLEEGGLLCILGSSGCGKTTTLNMIGGFLKPDGGRVLLDRQDITALPPERRPVSTVFQSYGLFPHMSVLQNVTYGLKFRGYSRAEAKEKGRRYLSLVGLAERENARIGELSGGQQQRVALARVLAVEPEVLLLDEPFGALDAQVREELRQWIKRLHRELGFTGVFVTHDQEEAMQVADRVVVMHNGRIEQADKPAEIWEHPKTRFVIEFLSDVNRIPAMISNGRLHVGTIDLALDGGADGRPVVDPKSIPDGPADLLLRPKDARMRRLEAEEDSAAAQKAGLLPVVIRSAVPKGGAIQVEAEPEGWYENALNAYVLEDALPRLGRGYLMSFERGYLYRGEERLPVHVRKPRWPFVGEHGHEHSSPEAAEPPKALKHEAALFI